MAEIYYSFDNAVIYGRGRAVIGAEFRPENFRRRISHNGHKCCSASRGAEELWLRRSAAIAVEIAPSSCELRRNRDIGCARDGSAADGYNAPLMRF
jgi:hypothetical protein